MAEGYVNPEDTNGSKPLQYELRCNDTSASLTARCPGLPQPGRGAQRVLGTSATANSALFVPKRCANKRTHLKYLNDRTGLIFFFQFAFRISGSILRYQPFLSRLSCDTDGQKSISDQTCPSRARKNMPEEMKNVALLPPPIPTCRLLLGGRIS